MRIIEDSLPFSNYIKFSFPFTSFKSLLCTNNPRYVKHLLERCPRFQMFETFMSKNVWSICWKMFLTLFRMLNTSHNVWNIMKMFKYLEWCLSCLCEAFISSNSMWNLVLCLTQLVQVVWGFFLFHKSVQPKFYSFGPPTREIKRSLTQLVSILWVTK